MNIAEQLAKLVGQEVELVIIWENIPADEPLITELLLMGEDDYQVGGWGFFGKYVQKIDGHRITYDHDLYIEEATEEYYRTAPRDPLNLDNNDEEWRLIGEAHMADLRKMGWEG